MEILIERIALALESIAGSLEKLSSPMLIADDLSVLPEPKITLVASEPAPLGGKTQTTVDIATRDTADLREQIGRTK